MHQFNYSARRLAAARIVVFGLWAMHIATYPLTALAEAPNFAPSGVLLLVPAPWLPVLVTPWALTSLKILKT